VEIGALWLDESMAAGGPLSFEMKCRPRAHCEIQPEALKVNGCTWLKDKSLPSETEALAAFASWLEGCTDIMIAGCQPGYDWHILKNGWRDAMQDLASPRVISTPFPFSFRTIDLHTAAVVDAFQAESGDQIPAGGLKSRQICAAFDLPEEPKPHRALAGAAWECRILRQLMGLK